MIALIGVALLAFGWIPIGLGIAFIQLIYKSIYLKFHDPVSAPNIVTGTLRSGATVPVIKLSSGRRAALLPGAGWKALEPPE